MHSKTLTYKDPKRYQWPLALLVPMLAAAGPILFVWTNHAWVFWLPVLFLYTLFPLLDAICGSDPYNPPDSAVAQLDSDRYYSWVLYLMLPLQIVSFVGAAAFLVQHTLPAHAWVALVICSGVVGGFCINVAHELGHQRSVVERAVAKLLLATTGYGHFTIEHNRGHHRDVATPDDPASARMGESIYQFYLREQPGTIARAWRLERDRMRKGGHQVFSLHNDILQCALMTIVFWGAITFALGPFALVFVVAASLWANFQLTSANYIEHYGLLRNRLESGRFEPCRPQHSWNSNHRVTNWALFHLQRHSDHHANATRRYQSLRTFDNVPQLPTGYFGMFLMAYVPPLFYAVMNPKVVRWAHANGAQINFAPSKRAQLLAQFGLAASG